MSFRLLLVLLFLQTAFCYSQEEYKKSVDSLYTLIKQEKNELKKIEHYQALCDIYYDYDLKALEKSNAELLQVAQKVKSVKGYGYYYCNKSKTESPINIMSSINYAEKGKKLFYKIKDWDNYIYACSLVAKNFIADKQLDKSKDLLIKTLSLALKKDSKYLANIYLLLCYNYNNYSRYETALFYAKKTINCKIPFKRKFVVYNIISLVYKKSGNFDKALEYNSLSISILKSKKRIHYALFDKACILYEMGRYQEQLPLLIGFEKYIKENPNAVDLRAVQWQLTICYYELGEYRKSDYYVDILIKGEENMYYYLHKAQIYEALNDIKTQKIYTDKGLNLLNDNYPSIDIIWAYGRKVQLERRLGNYKTALYYTEKIIKKIEDDYKNTNTKVLHQLEVDFKVTEKNNRIKNLKIAQLKKQMEINKKNSYLFYFICSLVVAFFIIGFLVLFFLVIRNKNRVINTTNLELEKESNKTQKSLLEKETLLKEIHHRVKNNMQLVISLLKIQARDPKQLSIENFIEISENRIRSMALIHEYLYESENINYVNFEEYIKRLSSSLLSSFSGQSDIKLETEIEDAHFDIETAIPLGLIINELVINAFKHAFVGRNQGKIKIQLFENEGLHHLVVSDNGVGIANNTENSASIGLKIVKLLVSQINGVMDIKKDLGTHFIIQFTNNNHTNEQ